MSGKQGREVMTKKTCTTCGESKPLDEFYRNHKGKHGRMAKCIPCSKPTAEQKWKVHLKFHYGLTVEAWTEMLISQQGRCYICSTAPYHSDLVVDHCHATEAVRKLLCRHCNIAAGAVFDDPEIATQLSNYLKEHTND